MTTVIRADASSRLGLGHWKRCLSLAAALRELGEPVEFVVARSDVAPAALVGMDEHRVHVVEPSAHEADDARRTLDALRGVDARGATPAMPSTVVVDHYGLSATWHRLVGDAGVATLAVVDDLADRPLRADVLIDHNLVPQPGHRARYAPVLQGEPRAWCCGPRFALLAPAYREPRGYEVADRVRSIGIFVGGSDPGDFSRTALRACRDAGFDGPIEIATTRANPNLDALRSTAADDGATSLSIDLADLADFHARHDLEIGAGGGAAWERCRIGVPTLALRVADNQRVVIDALTALGAAWSPAEPTPAAIADGVRRLLGDTSARRALSHAGATLIDGRGAERTALALTMQRPDALALRAVARDDARTLWRWRNDPRTRAVSRDARPIAWPDHERWLDAALADPGRRLWIARVATRDVGVVRFDDRGDARHEVSLYLDPALHGLGLGGAMLSAAERALTEDVGETTALAHVLPDNSASARMFAAAGYRCVGVDALAKSLRPGAPNPPLRTARRAADTP